MLSPFVLMLEQIWDIYMNNFMVITMASLMQLRYTDGKVLGPDEGIKLGLSDGKLLGIILGNVYVIALGIDVLTELGCLC